MTHLAQKSPWISDEQFDVFGGHDIDQLTRLCQITTQYRAPPTGQRLTCRHLTSQGDELTLKLVKHVLQQLFRGCHENGCSRRIVFSLREQIGCHKLRRGRIVSHNHYLTGSGQRVYIYATEDLSFGQGHENIART